jgi:type VI secretion system secreted protein VgrG
MAYTSDERICTVRSPLGDNALLLSHMTGHEALSSLFRFQCEFLSEKADLDFDAIIGQNLTLELKLRGGKLRHFNGIVARFSQGGSQGRFTAYSAEIMPWLWFLTRTSDCRIFQDQSVPEIIETVFRGYGLTDFKLPAGAYPPKHYCVQYRETDFNFVSRLMEEAGIGYFFQHTEKGHTCVLFDKPADNPACPDQKTATYARSAVGGAAVGDIEDWDVEREFPSGMYTLTDYNYTDPGTSLESTAPSTIKVGGNEKYEVYDYPGEYQSLGDGSQVAKLRMEAEEAASVVHSANTSCAAFSPGYRFDLKNHYRASYNDTYLIREVTHTVTQDVGEAGGEGSSYSNSITCMPHSIPYRPPQATDKPVISGVQTATVVADPAKEGEEIDVDDYGAIYVHFHWDNWKKKQGDRPERSGKPASCRVRVAQNWAGKNWGIIFHPRIGQEVVVQFLEGDPDRPLVIGRVYNAEQKVPYHLTPDGGGANKTQSGIKTRSSKEGTPENFNEIRFEDKKGEELFYVHSEKDREKIVENDEREDVGENRTRSVGNDETVTIGNNRKITVKMDHEETVDGVETLSVGKTRGRSVAATETITIGKDQSITVEAGRTVKVGATQDVEVGKDQNETIGGKYQSSVAKEYILQAKKIQLSAQDELSIEVGQATLLMKKNGDVTLNGKKINIKGSGDVIIKGSKIAEN